MKKFFYFFSALLVFVGCSNDDECYNEANSKLGNLVSPELFVTELNTNIPYSGILDIYPCVSGTSTYYGNYRNGQLSPLNPIYTIASGSIQNYVRPLLLPVGTYTLLYWGVASAGADGTYDYPASTEPALVLNEDMSSQYYGLRQYSSDTICYPIYDYVFAVKQVDLGSENIAVALQRKTAGINVTLKNEDSSSLATSIDSVRVYVGNLAEKVNVYNGSYENYTKTVMIPLTISGTQAVNKTAMVLPSDVPPYFRVEIDLKNGETKKYETHLSSILSPGTKLSIIMVSNIIFSETTEGSGFEVSDWTETEETITLPPLS